MNIWSHNQTISHYTDRFRTERAASIQIKIYWYTDNISVLHEIFSILLELKWLKTLCNVLKRLKKFLLYNTIKILAYLPWTVFLKINTRMTLFHTDLYVIILITAIFQALNPMQWVTQTTAGSVNWIRPMERNDSSELIQSERICSAFRHDRGKDAKLACWCFL